VEVRDTGIGIPPEQVERIWESFRSGESGLSRNYPGLGLGLAVARKLAALLGGSVHVVSDVGVGSVFTVEIPVGRPAAAVVNVSAQGAGDAVSAGPAILAVDDNPVGLKVLQRMLTRQHLHADCVGSSKEALEAAASRHYELVLMDLQMPEMDGLTAAAQMREIPGYESVPIIAVTAISSDQVREMCRNHGMQGFLSKPFEEEELAAIISRYLKPPQRS
jgi:CheY-like chemotaxis protein